MAIKWSIAGIWVLKLAASFIMLQTLYFKFSGADESVYIFSSLDMEPWGRIGTGVLELVASVLILYPATTAAGALLGGALMSGALFFHLTKLGISIREDGGQLFIYALIVWISCAILVIINRREIIEFINHYTNRK